MINNSFGDLTIIETLKLFAPLIIIQILLMAFCLYRLVKDRAKYLPKWAWALIIILGHIIGPIIYLIIGRERD